MKVRKLRKKLREFRKTVQTLGKKVTHLEGGSVGGLKKRVGSLVRGS
jgi:hypothetical protein